MDKIYKTVIHGKGNGRNRFHNIYHKQVTQNTAKAGYYIDKNVANFGLYFQDIVFHPFCLLNYLMHATILLLLLLLSPS